jgi:hypothetical protein
VTLRSAVEKQADRAFVKRLRLWLATLSREQRRTFDARLRASTKHIATSKR